MIDVLRSIFGKLDKYNRKVLNIYLILNVIWLFVGIFFYNYLRFSYQGFSVSLVFLFIINLMIIIYANVRKKVSFNKIDIFLILLVIFGIIACVFAQNVSVSLYGSWKRFEGFFQLLYYYSLFYLSTLSFNKKSIINFVLAFGLINFFISFLQVFDVLKFIPIANRGTTLAHGLITNSNFFCSYMVICLGLSLGLFLYSSNTFFKNVLNLFLVLCFWSGLLLSNALSGIVGLFFICLFIIIYFIYNIFKKQIRNVDIGKHALVFLLCLILFIVLSICDKTLVFNDVKNLFVETKNISIDIKKNNELSGNYGNGRMFIWKNIIVRVPRYAFHGVGVDCLLFAPDITLTGEFGSGNFVYFDKAHNEYLQKLICEGIFSLITYLGFLFVIFITSWKRFFKGDSSIIYLFLPFVGYCIQAFFNISVIEVAPLFFLVSGLLYDRNFKIEKC
ncbi:MAG: O-antigen ligase family protein [Bacilli bacterium]|nr:O-antigen ligase family protein [Bacilli bacterium]